MKDISYHILDIVQNSIHAGASLIHIHIEENPVAGTLELTITDNGCGMDAEMVQQVIDPFFTTSLKKKVGLGLPLLKQNAELTGGNFQLKSVPQKGTVVKAFFYKEHIDMIPMGDLAMTMRTLVSANPQLDFSYSHQIGKSIFELNTDEIRKELEGIPLNHPDVLRYISEYIRTNQKALSEDQNKNMNPK